MLDYEYIAPVETQTPQAESVEPKLMVNAQEPEEITPEIEEAILFDKIVGIAGG